MNSNEVGFVTKAQDYLFYLEGLPSSAINDIIKGQNGSRALVTGLEKDKIEAVSLSSDRPKPGDVFKPDPIGLSLPLGDGLFGRAINPLGEAIDGKGPIEAPRQPIDLDTVAPGIDGRKRIDAQLPTGMILIDTLLPIGKGQRELIFGEPRSGKTSFLLDVIVNQKGNNVICIYTALGKPEIDVRRFVESIHDHQAAEFTIVLAASSNQSVPLIAIAPAVACSIAENFRNQGKDCVLILDDLGTHAKYLREIGLLSGRIPGRESYPADIFYQHSHVIERAGSFNKNFGSGSITMLPVIETDMENSTNLVPTNLMSATDGHLLFLASLKAQGQYPGIDPERSVTRVGRQTQPLLHKEIAGRIRTLLADFAELQRYGSFGPELSHETQMKIRKGIIAGELIRQEPLEKIELWVQISLLGLLFSSFFEDRDPTFLQKYRGTILKTLGEYSDIKEMLQADTTDYASFMKKLEEKVPILGEKCK